MPSNVKYWSGDFTKATPVGVLRHESPLLPELNDVLIFHQDYVQIGALFVALPYNSVLDPWDPRPAYLYDESPRESFGGGVVKWTRSWARIPDTYGKAGQTYAFTFPAFGSGRNSFTRPVAMEITREFFLCGLGGQFNSWQEIPIIPAFQIRDGGDPIDVKEGVSDAVGTLPATTPSETEYRAMIAAGTFIDVEDSKVSNFRGGIYMRERYQVQAK